MHNLAAALSKRGKFDEAEELLRQEISLAETGVEKTAGMSDLAEFLVGRGRYDEAEYFLLDAVRLSAEVLGRDDRKTKSYERGLGVVYTKNGKYKEAEDILRGSLVISVT